MVLEFRKDARLERLSLSFAFFFPFVFFKLFKKEDDCKTMKKAYFVEREAAVVIERSKGRVSFLLSSRRKQKKNQNQNYFLFLPLLRPNEGLKSLELIRAKATKRAKRAVLAEKERKTGEREPCSLSFAASKNPNQNSSLLSFFLFLHPPIRKKGTLL